MSYHQRDKFCVACLTGSNERSPPPPSPPERYHPEDHEHEHPPVLHYEASEQHVLKTTGQLTMPMRVARELDSHGGTTLVQTMVPEHALMQEISSIISNRSLDTPAPDVHEHDVDDEEDHTSDPPTTPIQILTPSCIPESVFQGPIPETALNNTPLPMYHQAVTSGQAPVYDIINPTGIPLHRSTLQRISYYADLTSKLREIYGDRHIVNIFYKAVNIQTPHPALDEIMDALEVLYDALRALREEASRRHDIVFRYRATSATEEQVRAWIAEITRDPDNSVRSHCRRFSEWIGIIWEDYSSVIATIGASTALPPARRAINLAFEQEEIRDRMRMQGFEWPGSADDWVEPTPWDNDIIAATRKRDRWYTKQYGARDLNDSDFTEGYPATHLPTGRPLLVPLAYGVPRPSEFVVVRGADGNLTGYVP